MMLQMQKRKHNVNSELYAYSISIVSTFLCAILHMIMCINLVPTLAQRKFHVFF